MKPSCLTLDQQLRELVALASVSSVDPDLDMSNRPITQTLAQWCEDLGFHCRLDEVAPGKFNLLARIGHGEQGLLLAGHTEKSRHISTCH